MTDLRTNGWGRGVAAALLRSRGAAAALLTALLLLPGGADAQPAGVFGLRERSNAANQLVLQAVQQLLQALPPPVSQSYRYEFSDELGVMVREERVGASLLREPGTLGPGRFAARFSAAYFEAADSFVATYRNETAGNECNGPCYTVIGLAPSARVTALNFGLGYGIGEFAEVYLNLPVVITNASADVSYTNPIRDEAFRDFYADVDRDSADAIARGEIVPLPNLDRPGEVIDAGLRRRSLNDLAVGALGGESFSDGTNAGLGQVAIGAKLRVPTIGERLDLAINAELLLPSPNEDEFAGVDSAGFNVRLLSAVRLIEDLRLLTDVGYTYDGDFESLRGLTWTSGLALYQSWGTIDVGLGGSLYQEGIRWTPERIATIGNADQPVGRQEYVLAEGQTSELDNNFVDVRVGAKFPIGSTFALSAGAIVPVVGDDFRPDAIGSLGLEVYF